MDITELSFALNDENLSRRLSAETHKHVFNLISAKKTVVCIYCVCALCHLGCALFLELIR